MWKKCYFCYFIWISVGFLHLIFRLKKLILHRCWVYLVMLSYSNMVKIPSMLSLLHPSIAGPRSSSMRPSWTMTSWRNWSPSTWSRWWTACVGASTRRDSWSSRRENLGITSTYFQVTLAASSSTLLYMQQTCTLLTYPDIHLSYCRWWLLMKLLVF